MSVEKWMQEQASLEELRKIVVGHHPNEATHRMAKEEIHRRETEESKRLSELAAQAETQRHQEALAESRRANDLAEAKLKRDAQHTLWAYWKLANWQERAGTVGVFFGLIGFGFRLAQNSVTKRILDFILSVKP